MAFIKTKLSTIRPDDLYDTLRLTYGFNDEEQQKQPGILAKPAEPVSDSDVVAAGFFDYVFTKSRERAAKVRAEAMEQYARDSAEEAAKIRSILGITRSKAPTGQLSDMARDAMFSSSDMRGTELTMKDNAREAQDVAQPMITPVSRGEQPEMADSPAPVDAPSIDTRSNEMLDKAIKDVLETVVDSDVSDSTDSADGGAAPSGGKGIMSRDALTDDDMGLPSGAMFTAKDAQKALGFTGNEVDGNFGPNSRKRLLDFQRKAGIPLTGDFNDPATRAALINPDSTDPRKVVPIDPSPDLTTSGNIDMDKVTEYIKTAVQNPLKAAGIIGTIRQELGRGAIRTEDMGYRLGKKATANSSATGAYAVFRESDVDAALANLSSAQQARAKTNVPMNALGQAIMDIKYDGGHQYRGRGLVQITNKDMYKQVGDKIGVDLVENPELVNDPKYAVPAAIALLEIKDYFGKDTTKNNLRSMINPGQSDAKRDERWDYVESALADIRGS